MKAEEMSRLLKSSKPGWRTSGRMLAGEACSKDMRCLTAGAAHVDGSTRGSGEHMVSSWLPSDSCTPADAKQTACQAPTNMALAIQMIRGHNANGCPAS